MNRSKNSPRSLLHLSSLLVGAGVVTVVLVLVYVLLPTADDANQIAEDTSLEDTVGLEQTPLAAEDDSVAVVETASQGSGIDLSEIHSFEDVLSNFSSPFEQHFALYHLAGQANDKQVRKLLDEVNAFEFDITNINWQQNALSILLRRMIMFDPSVAILHIQKLPNHLKDKLAYWCFYDWATVDLEGAISFVSPSDYSPLIYSAADGILDANTGLPIEELKALADQLGWAGESYMEDNFAEDLYAEALEHPEESWYELVAEPKSLEYDNMSRIKTIVNAWVAQDGIGILDKVAESIKDENFESSVLSSALRAATDSTPNEAFDYALALDDKATYGYFAQIVLGQWARLDPNSALERVQEIESGQYRNQLVKSLFSAWASHDVDEVLGEMDRVPEELRDPAQVAVIQSLAWGESVEDAVSLLTDIQDTEQQTQAARSLAMGWANRDMEAALDWVMTDPTVDSMRDELIGMVLNNAAHTSPDKAFELALAQPPIGDGADAVGLEAQVLTMIGYANINKAVELLPQVRDGKTKVRATHGVGNALAMNGRVEEAIALGSQIPADEQVTYYTTIGSSSISMGMFTETDISVFETLDLIPSEEAQSRTALSAVMLNAMNEKFSEEEVESLKEYMTEEDLEALEEVDGQQGIFNMPFLGL